MCFKKCKSLFMFFLVLLVVLGLTSCEDNSALTDEVEITTPGDVRQIHLNEDSLSVTLSYPGDSTVSIRYTTDESDVTESSPLYSESFSITGDTTVKAKAFRDSGIMSTLSEKKYYKVTEEFSDKDLLQARISELIADDELGPEGDYNHLGLDSSLTDLSYLFNNDSLRTTFNGDISAWDVSKVTNMYAMFLGAISFNQPLNDWDVSQITTISSLFEEAISFNQPLNGWDVSNVKNMDSTFFGAFSFNQPLNKWDVANVKYMANTFYRATLFNQPLNDWDVSSVKNMQGMFYLASSFNQALNDWNVSKVIEASYMFAGDGADNMTIFNQDISSWELNSLENASYMFKYNENFNQDLTGWNDDLPDETISYDNIITNCPNMDNTKLPIKLGGSTT